MASISYRCTIHSLSLTKRVPQMYIYRFRYNSGIHILFLQNKVQVRYLFHDVYFRYTIFSVREIKLGYNLDMRCTWFKRYSPGITYFLIRN